MITRYDLAIICRRLNSELHEAGFVFSDIQFDESEQTLRIVLEDEPNRRLSNLPRAGSASGASIDARVFWDLLRDLIKLGLTHPAVQLRYGPQDQSQIHEVHGSDNSRSA